MALRFRPADTTFYDLFTQAAGHLVEGAGLLAEMLGDGMTVRTSPSGCVTPSTPPTRPRT